MPKFTLAVAAGTHVKPQRSIAPLIKHLAGYLHICGLLVAAKAMQANDRRQFFAGLHIVRQAKNAGQL